MCTFFKLKSPKQKPPLDISENGFFINRPWLRKNTKRVDAAVYLVSAMFNRQDYTEYGSTTVLYFLAHFIHIRQADFLHTNLQIYTELNLRQNNIKITMQLFEPRQGLKFLSPLKKFCAAHLGVKIISPQYTDVQAE